MFIRVISPVKGHRGIEVKSIPVSSLTKANLIGFAHAQDPLQLVDLIDNKGKILHRYETRDVLILDNGTIAA